MLSPCTFVKNRCIFDIILTSVYVLVWSWPVWNNFHLYCLSSSVKPCKHKDKKLTKGSPIIGEFPAQRPVTRSFDAFFDMPLNKERWGWWFETLSCPLWHHCNENILVRIKKANIIFSRITSKILNRIVYIAGEIPIYSNRRHTNYRKMNKYIAILIQVSFYNGLAVLQTFYDRITAMEFHNFDQIFLIKYQGV